MDDHAIRRHLPLTANTFQILLSLARGPLHGWAVRHEVEERTDGRVRLGAGALYTAIQRMERDDLITETPCPPDLAEEANSRWRFYEATELGRRVLKAEMSRMQGDLEAARRTLAEAP